MRIVKKLYDVAGPLIDNLNNAYLDLNTMKQFNAEDSDSNERCAKTIRKNKNLHNVKKFLISTNYYLLQYGRRR